MNHTRHRLLDDYEKLNRLLISQSVALSRNQSEKLHALSPMIEKYASRVAEYTGFIQQNRDSLGGRLSGLLAEARQRTHHNLQAWSQRRDKIREELEGLRSLKQYARCSGAPPRSAGRRLNRQI